jgi:predicted nucleic acid-binding protein
MKFVVLDANVSVKWYIAEQDSDLAQKLLESEFLFLAPDIFLVEVVGALIRQHREYRQISKEDLLSATEDLLRIGIETISSAILLGRAVEISLAVGHPIKDCLYLALAERWQTVVVSADNKFVDKISQSEWAKHVTLLANVDQIV